MSCGCKIVQKEGKIHPLWKGYGEIPSSYFSSFRCKAKKKKIEFIIQRQKLKKEEE